MPILGIGILLVCIALLFLGQHPIDKIQNSYAIRDFDMGQRVLTQFRVGITTSIGMDVSLNRTQSANVLGLIPGSDPELSKEVVIYTAHHDHLGIGKPNAEGDNIYNGARDNASGVAVVLAIAKSLAAQRRA